MADILEEIKNETVDLVSAFFGSVENCFIELIIWLLYFCCFFFWILNVFFQTDTWFSWYFLIVIVSKVGSEWPRLFMNTETVSQCFSEWEFSSFQIFFFLWFCFVLAFWILVSLQCLCLFFNFLSHVFLFGPCWSWFCDL